MITFEDSIDVEAMEQHMNEEGLDLKRALEREVY